MKKYLFVSLCIISSSVFTTTYAQVNDDQVLMTVGDRPVSLHEFKSMYYKNLPKDSLKNQKTLDNYLNLFTDFRLKVNAALDARIDTTPSFRQEMNEYRQKLADPYMRDTAVENALVKQAYERMLTDVRSEHILIKVSPDAAPADTLAAYNKILKIREEIEKKQITFENAAKKYSEDTRTAPMGGDIGYQSSLGVAYAFENALYNTKVGSVSMPVHTSFGYHLVKVIDRKPDQGMVQVAHIMIRTPNKMSPADSLKIIQKIDSIYTLVKNGEDFGNLAKKLSQDPNSGRHGGTLPWFGVGKVPPVFEDACFALKNVGDVSKPVRSPYGWHIIKLLGKKGPPAFTDSVKESISAKVLKDERSELSVDALVAESKQKYGFKEDAKAKEAMYKVIDETFYKNKWTVDKASGMNEIVFTIGTKGLTQQDFAQFLAHNQMGGDNKGGEYAVNRDYPKFVKEQILKYKNEMLEKESPYFAEMINEYRDGILLFDVTDKMVWTKALKDTAGLRAYYQTHNTNYMYGERADASIFTCKDDKVAKEVKKLAKDGKTDKAILAEVNAKDSNAASVQSNLYEKKDNALVDASWKVGASDDQNVKGKIEFVYVRKVIAPSPKNLDDVRGMVTTEYQNYLMTQWLTELRAKYPVKIDQKVLAQAMPQ